MMKYLLIFPVLFLLHHHEMKILLHGEVYFLFFFLDPAWASLGDGVLFFLKLAVELIVTLESNITSSAVMSTDDPPATMQSRGSVTYDESFSVTVVVALMSMPFSPSLCIIEKEFIFLLIRHICLLLDVPLDFLCQTKSGITHQCFHKGILPKCILECIKQFCAACQYSKLMRKP